MSKRSATARYLHIGELAERAGVSTKALRLYERHGLLQPDMHSPSGYRMYGPESVVRLRQILLLKRAGFRLAEIGGLLARDASIAESLLQQKRDALRVEVAGKTALLRSLERLLARIDSASTLDQLLESITMSTQLPDVDLTPAQREAMQQRLCALGEQGVRLAQDEWPRLISQVQAAIDGGVAADSDRGQGHARRWKELVDMATGGDPAVARKVGEAWQASPEAMAQMGMTPALMHWISQAMQAAGVSFD